MGAHPVQLATPTSPSPVQEQPLRLLLVRSRPGELPWLATAIAKTMAPVEIVEVIGFANAIWRLGSEGFDSVLLDVELHDPEAIAYCREQIAEVAAVPVLNLRDQAEGETLAERTEPERRPAEKHDRSTRRSLRVPWQRRPRRQPQPTSEAEAASAG
jgi:hypothetical protein